MKYDQVLIFDLFTRIDCPLGEIERTYAAGWVLDLGAPIAIDPKTVRMIMPQGRPPRRLRWPDGPARQRARALEAAQ